MSEGFLLDDEEGGRGRLFRQWELAEHVAEENGGAGHWLCHGEGRD